MTIPQTDQFVPLVASAPSAEKRDFQITVIPQKEQSQPFQSLEKAIPATRERLGKTNCEPQLSIQRDGERITNIRIQCNCGQTIDLACVYDEQSKAR
jgi:hypothetical protein